MPKDVTQRRTLVGKMAVKKRTVKGIEQLVYPTARSIQQGLTRLSVKVSLKSVKRDLQAKGFRCLVRPRVATRDPVQLRTKKAFAKKELADIRARRKRIPFFSDECWISTSEGGSRTQWVRDRSHLLARARKCRWNEAASLQVWGVVGLNYRYIHIMPAKQRNDEGKLVGYTLNAARYIRKCLSPIRHSLRGQRLQQDGARCHFAAEVRSYLHRHNVETFAWPAASPELNMIEHVWSILKTAVAELAPSNEAELRAAIRTAWNAIPVAVLNSVVSRYTAALEMAAMD